MWAQWKKKAIRKREILDDGMDIIKPDLEILITPLKGCSQLKINQFLTIYHLVFGQIFYDVDWANDI